MALAGQTITIVNKSGKIVKSSKHLVNIFNEAKTAYNEKKAEIKAQREVEWAKQSGPEHDIRTRLDALHVDSVDDGHARTIRRKPVPAPAEQRPSADRGLSESFMANEERHVLSDHPAPTSTSPQRQGARQVEAGEPRIRELTRRHTDGAELIQRRKEPRPRRPSVDEIDMDLAYGEIPPPLPARRYDDEIELRSKMSGLQRLLDECNCVQHTVTAMIDNLQKNPEALAAVALTLGEISNLAMKMAPGALSAMKTSFPAIVALLASPQFAIAAGVGVGVTIIALGGYKIIKRIKAKNEEARLLESPLGVTRQLDDSPANEMDELREINHIERWRRGIADAEAESLGTSVDGEFITPQATRALVREGKLTEADLKPPHSIASKSRRSKRKAKSTYSSASKVKSASKSSARSKSAKEPSGLKMLFMSRSK